MIEALREILSIKRFRETRAELAMQKQGHVLRLARTTRDDAEQALASFHACAVRQERALYDELCRRLVRLRDLENAQLEVAALSRQEGHFAETLRQREQALLAEQARMAEARQLHRQAFRMKEKFIELTQAFAEEQLRDHERREDAEMEEVAELRRDRAEQEEFAGEFFAEESFAGKAA